MATGHKLPYWFSKKLLSYDALNTFSADMRDAFDRFTEYTWGVPGFFLAVTIDISTTDRFSLESSGAKLKGIDYLGRVIDPTEPDAGVTSAIYFENANAIDYYIALTRASSASGVESNPRTGDAEYSFSEEVVGYDDQPSSVTDNGDGTFTLVVDSVTESGVDNSGRTVRVYLNDPQTSVLASAIQDLTVTWDGVNNKVTSADSMGQSTISTTKSDYHCILLGPRVSRNTDFSADATALYVGKVTGGGAGIVPSAQDTTGQRVFTTGGLGAINDIVSFLDLGFQSNPLSGAAVTDGGALDVDISAASLLVSGLYTEVTADSVTLPNNLDSYIIYDQSAEGYDYVASLPLADFEDVLIARVTTAAGAISEIVDLRRFATNMDGRVDVLVGSANTEAHFTNLADAVAFCGEMNTPASGSPIRAFNIKIIGSVTVAGSDTPIVIPSTGISVEGSGWEAYVQWGADNALFDLNGASFVEFRNIRFLFSAATAGVAATRYVFDDDSAGTLDHHVYENLTLEIDDKESHGFLNVDGASTLQDWTIRNIRCEATVTDNAIVLDPNQGSRITISDCYLTQGSTAIGATNLFAVVVESCDNVLIQGCYAANFSAGGFRIGTGSNVATANSLVECWAQAGADGFVIPAFSSRVNVTDCHAVNNTDNGIIVGGSSEKCRIAGCSIVNPSGDGIEIAGAIQCAIDGCDIDVTGSTGIRIHTSSDDCKISNTHVYLSDNVGIYIADSKVGVVNCSVKSAQSHGIEIDNGDLSSVVGTTVDTTAAFGNGIYIHTGSAFVRVSNCHVESADNYGIITTSSSTRIANCTVNGCQLYGINLSSADNCSVIGCRTYQNGQDGGAIRAGILCSGNRNQITACDTDPAVSSPPTETGIYLTVASNYNIVTCCQTNGHGITNSAGAVNTTVNNRDDA